LRKSDTPIYGRVDLILKYKKGNLMNQKGKKLPHIGVYTRLAPSRISGGGVGVFAIRKIGKNADIFYDEYDEMIWINVKELESLPAKIRKLYDDFCVIKDNGTRYGCPKSFNQLIPCWYLNSSETPNVRCDEKNGYKFYALRNIIEGEELTVDYTTYSELPVVV
jgi:hypothetical protein